MDVKEIERLNPLLLHLLSLGFESVPKASSRKFVCGHHKVLGWQWEDLQAVQKLFDVKRPLQTFKYQYSVSTYTL